MVAVCGACRRKLTHRQSLFYALAFRNEWKDRKAEYHHLYFTKTGRDKTNKRDKKALN